MQLTKTHKVIISILTAVILFGGYVYFDRRSKSIDNSLAIQSTTTASGVNLNTQGSGDYKVEQVPAQTNGGVPEGIPDLNRPVTGPNSAKVSADAIVLATQKILALQAHLKQTPADFDSWLDLGMYQKMAGDYDGTILSWQYTSKLAPTSYIPLANLGNLYAYFLKDNVTAEMYYKEAIAKDSSQGYLYTQLAEIYRDLFKDLDKARAIVNQGLQQLPTDANLLQLKDSLK